MNKEAIENDLFKVGMYWRIGYGFIRTLFGLVLLRLVGSPLIDVFHKAMSFELIEDPTDVLYSAVTSLLEHHTFYITYFLAFYFIFWGLIDVILSINLLRGKHWSFIVSFWLIGAFVAYEIYRFTFTHSLLLLWIIFVDLVILYLIWEKHKSLHQEHIFEKNIVEKIL